MIIVAITIGCVLGALIGVNAPVISYMYSNYLAIAIIAALDSVFGGITSVLKGNFDIKIFTPASFLLSIYIRQRSLLLLSEDSVGKAYLHTRSRMSSVFSIHGQNSRQNPPSALQRPIIPRFFPLSVLPSG